MEIWKDINGYEGYYQISSEGQVKSLISNKILTGDTNNLGYKRVTLYTPIKKRFFIHRLVALHFCEGYTENLVVNHKDGNKQKNYSFNLEWVSQISNMQHALQSGLWSPKKCGIAAAKKCGTPVRCITTGEEFPSVCEAGRYYKVP